MSRDNSSVRYFSRSNPISRQLEENENDSDKLGHHTPLHPSRTPFNSIQDSSQLHRPSQDFPQAVLDTQQLILPKGIGATPRVSARGGKLHSEPNSAQSTPAKAIPRVSNVGGKGGSFSRNSKGVSIARTEPVIEVPHFDLVENPSFWKDHNVQVLIRIRPLNNVEKVSQDYGRCLRQESAQTLLWLGHPETRFTFDHVACESLSQEKLFKVAGLPIVENCMSGYNSCIFAYGQTGSGKTYTMMGEIDRVEGKLSNDCGITPRIFEYLFKRIREEEDKRRNERLEYSCKCSFLEIYNEQITDLLEPSSTNLQLREDLKKGVYVENLTEYSVRTVDDVISLLVQGAANRKMAATHMNSESSRSHSVFTCIVESRWEKDSMTHLRFGRLNLVDLAGSERQKSSGAEGDRLKEAANINKSLSTLGLVIMSLVDLAHGKHRHVPYRDSRLTFLLQDSLGGNSKTTIIANVSPSICSANETLSTLKFAQRAKLIQNNAKINEDASGDITALQQQIQQLKDQLSSVMKHHKSSEELSHVAPNSKESTLDDFSKRSVSSSEKMNMVINLNSPSFRGSKVMCSQRALLGAIRRERLSEFEVKRLKTEIEQMDILVHELQEDAQHTTMMLSLRDEKIKCLELLADGLSSADKYLLDENNALRKEIEVLKERIQKNPDLVKMTLEKNRVLDQLRLMQDFYEQGERETLQAELSDIRDQFLKLLEVQESSGHTHISTSQESQDNSIAEDLEGRDANPKLVREDEQFQKELKNWNQPTCHSVMLHQNDPVDESFNQPENGEYEDGPRKENELVLQFNDIQKELENTRYLLEVMESEQIRLIEELEFMQNENKKLREILENQKIGWTKYGSETGCYDLHYNCAEEKALTGETKDKDSISKVTLQSKLNKLSRDPKGQLITYPCLEDQVLQMSRDHQIEMVQKEVEMETTKTILQLQEEITILQSELQERLHSMAEENACLRNTLAAKDDEIRQLSTEWERATLELTMFLTGGSVSLEDAASQVESISCSFTCVNVWISEHVEKAAKMCIEKEKSILMLKESLEDAQKTVLEMQQKLNSLKGVTIALTEFQELEDDTSRTVKVPSAALNDELIMDKHLEKIKMRELLVDDEMDDNETNINASVLSDRDTEMVLTHLGILEVGNCIKASCLEAESHFSLLQSAIHEAFSLYKKLILDIVNDIRYTRRSFSQLKTKNGNLQINAARSPQISSSALFKHDKHKEILYDKHKEILYQVKEELLQISGRLNCLNAFYEVADKSESLATAESQEEADGWSSESSTSSCKSSAMRAASEMRLKICSSTGYERINKKNFEEVFEQGFKGSPFFSSDNQELEESKRMVKSSIPDEATLACLQKDLRFACDTLLKIYALLTAEFCPKDTLTGSITGLSIPHSLAFLTNNVQPLIKDDHKLEITPEMEKKVQADEELVQKDEFLKQFSAVDKISRVDRFIAKFEKAHVAITEADLMLNELMKANENAKQLTSAWKQIGEDLMIEKESLLEEIEQLKSFISLKDRENEQCQEQVHLDLMEIENLAVLLKGSLQQHTEEICTSVYSDAIIMVKDALNSICSFRSLSEDIFSLMMENEIHSFVLHRHFGELDYESRCLNLQCVSHASLGEAFAAENYLGKSFVNFGNGSMLDLVKSRTEWYRSEITRKSESEDHGLVHDDLIVENVALKRELQRKEVILKGLFFDFSLLQESASSNKDAKDEVARLTKALDQAECELKLKISQFDELVIQHRILEGRLSEAESALSVSNFDLEQMRGQLDILSEQSADFRILLKDLYLQKSEAEQQLEGQREIIRDLENEILRMASSMEKDLASSMKDVSDDLERMTMGRDELLDQLYSLQDRLDIANALADEKEAIALEARQESEASKVYAEQKEEEVQILEHSVEELEYTVNVLEKKVDEMEEEVERHRTARYGLEIELQSLRERLQIVESFSDDLDSRDSSREPSSRLLHEGYVELQEFHNQIRVLEEEKARLAEEVKQYRDYISELIMHAEAQSSQYQQKYKNLEAMVQEVSTGLSNGITGPTNSEKTEKSSVKVRGSSSPFRCISNLVQQMNLEKDQELSIAKNRIEELEALLATRQKEVCLVNTRLAAVESMTHDVIRDLLGVKLDMTNYADLISQNRLQKFVEEAQQQTRECTAMEKEVFNLRSQIRDLMEERERCVLEMKRKEADMLTVHVTVEQLRERDQLLAAQNEMLKADKTNLQRRVAELDDLVKKLVEESHQTTNGLSRPKDNNRGRRLNHHSEKPLPRWNNV